MSPNKTVFSSLLLAVFVIAISCSGTVPPKPAGMPNPVPCTIIVQDESGSPIAGALVRLVPESGSQWGASGATDASGTATVKTEGYYAGAVPGKYKILVSKSELIQTGQMSDEGLEITQTNVLIDPKFAAPATTPLTVEVGSGGASETVKVQKP